MKKEKAIRVLEQIEYYLKTHTNESCEEEHMALALAIKALEKENKYDMAIPEFQTESLISRYQNDTMSSVFMASPTEVIKVGEPLSNSDEIRQAFENREIYKRGFEDARKMYERPTGEWILINDKQLPKEGESVLVCIKTQGGISQYVSERFHGNQWSALGGRTPIAWMPLPKPYKEAENEV